jgi:hypothetical protein
MPNMATNATKTGTAMVQNRTSISNALTLKIPSHPEKKSVVIYKRAITMQARKITPPLAWSLFKVFHLYGIFDFMKVGIA